MYTAHILLMWSLLTPLASRTCCVTEPPVNHVPAIWGKTLSTLPGYSYQKAATRLKRLNQQAVLEYFDSWEQLFKLKHMTEITRAELLVFILQLDPFWEQGANRAAVMVECQQKLEYLPVDAVRTWQTALKNKTGNTANRLNVIGYLFQSSLINPNCKFDQAKSSMMLARLNGLTPEILKTWQDALALDQHQAAMSVIETSAFNDDANKFKDDAFRKVVQELKVAAAQKPPRKGK